MKFGVIGLGRFGYQVATVLSENGMEVVAVDNNEPIVASISNQVTQALCMNVTDEAGLRAIGMDEMDTVVVAMGENFAGSILITALLKKKLNVPKVITRAINDIHKEIVTLVGADQVVLPEREIGIRLADNLSSPFTDLVRLSKEFAVSQMPVPHSFIGHTIASLNLYENYGLSCVGVKRGSTIDAADPGYVLTAKDRIIVAGNREHIAQLTHL